MLSKAELSAAELQEAAQRIKSLRLAATEHPSRGFYRRRPDTRGVDVRG